MPNLKKRRVLSKCKVLIPNTKKIITLDGKKISMILRSYVGKCECLCNFYCNWINYNKSCAKMNNRLQNIPENLSEGLFCYVTNSYQVVNIKSSGLIKKSDCYDPKTNHFIQVKSASVIPDLTSFGPDSKWNDLYFMDFSRIDKVKIYLIPNKYIYNVMVNKTETFRQQQKQGRRPRFSIYTEIIKKHKLKPKYTCEFTNI